MFCSRTLKTSLNVHNSIIELFCVFKTMVANKSHNETTEVVGTLNVLTVNTETHLLNSPSLQARFSYTLF